MAVTEEDLKYLDLDIDINQLSCEEQFNYFYHYFKTCDLGRKKDAQFITGLVSTFMGAGLGSFIAYGESLAVSLANKSPEMVDIAKIISDASKSWGTIGAGYALFALALGFYMASIVNAHKCKIEASRLSKYNKGLLIKHGNKILRNNGSK